MSAKYGNFEIEGDAIKAVFDENGVEFNFSKFITSGGGKSHYDSIVKLFQTNFPVAADAAYATLRELARRKKSMPENTVKAVNVDIAGTVLSVILVRGSRNGRNTNDDDLVKDLVTDGRLGAMIACAALGMMKNSSIGLETVLRIRVPLFDAYVTSDNWGTDWARLARIRFCAVQGFEHVFPLHPYPVLGYARFLHINAATISPFLYKNKSYKEIGEEIFAPIGAKKDINGVYIKPDPDSVKKQNEIINKHLAGIARKASQAKTRGLKLMELFTETETKVVVDDDNN